MSLLISPRAIMKHKKTISMVLRIGLSITLLILLFRLIDSQGFMQLFTRMSPSLFIVGAVLYLLAVILSAFRWQLVLRADGVRVRFRHLTEINLVGMLFTNFLPTAVGGDVARMYEFSRQSGQNTQAVSTVLLDRMFGLISLVVMAVIALAAGYRYAGERAVLVVVVAVVIGFVIFWVLFFNKGFVRKFIWVFKLPILSRFELHARALYNSMFGLKHQRGLVISAIIVSLLLQGTEVISAVFIARSLNIEISTVYFFIFLPMIWLVTMIPLSLNGLGIREGAFTFFFGQVGVLPAEAVALSLLIYSCRLFVGVLGGIIFFLRTFNASRLNHKTIASD